MCFHEKHNCASEKIKAQLCFCEKHNMFFHNKHNCASARSMRFHERSTIVLIVEAQTCLLPKNEKAKHVIPWEAQMCFRKEKKNTVVFSEREKAQLCFSRKRKKHNLCFHKSHNCAPWKEKNTVVLPNFFSKCTIVLPGLPFSRFSVFSYLFCCWFFLFFFFKFG